MHDESPKRDPKLRLLVLHDSFEDADAAEILEHLAMTPEERICLAAELQRRVWPGPNPDVREWERTR